LSIFFLARSGIIPTLTDVSDPPIKRLAQRHMYLGTDAIADRDLGFAIARRVTNTSVGRTETSTSILTGSQQTNTAPHGHGAGAGSSKPQRGATPEHRKREDGRGGDYSAGHKRPRPISPPPPRGPDRDRESRWDGPSSRRRFSPPPPAMWEREDRGGGGGGPGRNREPMPPSRLQEREEEKSRQGTLPQVLSHFIGELPTPSSFDGNVEFLNFCSGAAHTHPFPGPVFRTDDLMNLFRNAVIPSTSSRPKSPPPRSGKHHAFVLGRLRWSHKHFCRRWSTPTRLWTIPRTKQWPWTSVLGSLLGSLFSVSWECVAKEHEDMVRRTQKME